MKHGRLMLWSNLLILTILLVHLPAFSKVPEKKQTISSAKTDCSSRTVISGFVADVFFLKPDELLSGFSGSSVNTLATTLAWSVIEKQQGKVDLSPYYPQLDALSKAGYCLILLVDTSGRKIKKNAVALGLPSEDIPEISIPEWTVKIASNAGALDFYGGLSQSIEFEDTQSLKLVQRFYKAVIPELKKRYGSQILAVSPCITSECEVKFTQNGFKWESYSPQSQAAFADYLKSMGRPAAKMPVMDYGNFLKNGNPKVEPLYPLMQQFRENSIKRYACSLTQYIRSEGLQSIGYFGQAFAMTDGIYATGVIETVKDCFDIVSIDYNFYNGYNVEFRAEIPAFLAHYALDLGYKKVLVGMYMENFRRGDATIDPRGYALLQKAIEQIPQNKNIVGIEVGNLMGKEFQNLNYAEEVLNKKREKTFVDKNKKRLALYASVSNFYLWEGDWSNDRQVLQDNLMATYLALRSIPNAEVHIVSDVQLREQPWSLGQYDLLFLPHQTSMPWASRQAILRYLDMGGKAIADMRLDEYLSDGTIQKDMALRKHFGIGAQQAYAEEAEIFVNATVKKLSKQNQYVEGFWLAPSPGFKVAFPRVSGKGEGLLVQGKQTSFFGLMPLLFEGNEKEWVRKQFYDEVARLIQ